jgi:hypothetical protein
MESVSSLSIKRLVAILQFRYLHESHTKNVKELIFNFAASRLRVRHV